MNEVKVKVKVKVEPCEMSVAYFTGEVEVAPPYAPATGGFYSVTEVKPCEMSVAYFTGETIIFSSDA